MSVETKRREILQMLAKGSISSQEAAELLSQIETDTPPPQAIENEGEESETTFARKPRWLNVQVSELGSGRDKVSIKIPLGLARIGLRLGAKFAPEVEDLDWDEMLSQIGAAGDQMLVEVQDKEDGELVRIFVS